MEAETLIRQCMDSGADLVPEGGKLRVRGWSKLTPTLQSGLSRHKEAVIECLGSQWTSGPEESKLFAWASELAERDLVLSSAVSYVEAPRRRVTTERISWYAAHYLRAIAFARMNQMVGGWGVWTIEWWKDREDEALAALRALESAFAKAGAMPS